jgi:hypothetical protein
MGERMNLPSIFRLKRCDKPRDGVFAYMILDPTSTFIKIENGKEVTFEVKGSHYIEETYKDGELLCGQGWFSPTEKMTL